MKKLIDIEKLVQWALRDEMPKGFRLTADIHHIVKRKLYRRGKLIADTLGAVYFDDGEYDNFGKMPGEAHADAQLVADAISSLETSMHFDHRRDVLRLFGEWSLIADDYAHAILAMRFDTRELVLDHGLNGTRPNWEFDQPAALPTTIVKRNAAGAARSSYVVTGFNDHGEVTALAPLSGKAAMKHGRHDLDREPRCPLSWHGLQAIGVARAQYFAWQVALAKLAIDLAGKLSQWEPMPPIVRPYPWHTGQGGSTRILSDGRSLGVELVSLPLQPKRYSGGKPKEAKIISESRPRAHVLRLARQRFQKAREKRPFNGPF
jgi:hypothetical protein